MTHGKPHKSVAIPALLLVEAYLRGLFPEFVRLQQGCKYPNCTHDHEPECAVLDALEDDEISQTRYMSYLEMLVEASPDDYAADDGFDDVEEED